MKYCVIFPVSVEDRNTANVQFEEKYFLYRSTSDLRICSLPNRTMRNLEKFSIPLRVCAKCRNTVGAEIRTVICSRISQSDKAAIPSALISYGHMVAPDSNVANAPGVPWPVAKEARTATRSFVEIQQPVAYRIAL